MRILQRLLWKLNHLLIVDRYLFMKMRLSRQVIFSAAHHCERIMEKDNNTTNSQYKVIIWRHHQSIFIWHLSNLQRHLSIFIRPSIDVHSASVDVHRASVDLHTIRHPSIFIPSAIRSSSFIPSAIRRSSHHSSLLHHSILNDQKTEKSPVYKGKSVFVCTLTTQPLAQCTFVGDQFLSPMSQD